MTDKKLVAVIFDFENCETARVPISIFKELYFNHIQPQDRILYRVFGSTIDYQTNSAESFDYAELIMDLDQLNKIKTSYSDLSPEDNLTVGKHLLTWPDICYIDLVYDDDSVRSLTAPWKDLPKRSKEDIDSNNAYQHKQILQANGQPDLLQIIISKTDAPL